MARTEHYFSVFECDQIYHVYNCTVDKKPLFTQERNYIYFLNKMDLYLTPVLDVYAWCLMSNHFHLMVKIKDKQAFANMPDNKLTERSKPEQLEFISGTVSNAFGKMFQSYAMAFNKQEGRNGSLFQHPFKRALITNDSYLTNIVYYIHANPQHHGFISDFRNYKWSSYQRMVSPQATKLKKESVLDWFGGADKYIEFHSTDHGVIEPSLALED